MVKVFAVTTATAVLAIATASAASVPDGTWPTSQGNVYYTEPIPSLQLRPSTAVSKPTSARISRVGARRRVARQPPCSSSRPVALSRMSSSVLTKWRASTAMITTAPSRTCGGTTSVKTP
ncbi:unnamed protein product [Phytophthora fragariaefolia]|uniref:Unnamed protein product n=1 Tax=Phytophthora fragariaefolia TaxID=1490495 RepID=A0A9W6YG14_9STRA|nr:unnamed protein product [Phytophthora fragariaefolia]